MKEKHFDKLVEETCEKVKTTLIVKGKEYRRNQNVFHNFEEAARISNTTREKALEGFALKHKVSINDMINDIEKGILPTKEAVEEKFGDLLIYTIILKASILDRIENKEKNE